MATTALQRGLYSHANLPFHQFQFPPTPNNSNVFPGTFSFNLNFQQFNVTAQQLIDSGIQFPILVIQRAS